MKAKTCLPLWLKISYTLLVCIVVPVYWRDLGPTNFLWFSDIALILMVPALWLESRFLSSTMAVGVLVLEIAWFIDFIAGGSLLQIAAYMFSEGDPPMHIRVLSGAFHMALPPTILFMLHRLGYDPRALPAQALLASAVLPITFLTTDPADNINWVFGPAQPQDLIPSVWYLLTLYAAFIFILYIPSHFAFKKLFVVHAPKPQSERLRK